MPSLRLHRHRKRAHGSPNAEEGLVFTSLILVAPLSRRGTRGFFCQLPGFPFSTTYHLPRSPCPNRITLPSPELLELSALKCCAVSQPNFPAATDVRFRTFCRTISFPGQRCDHSGTDGGFVQGVDIALFSGRRRHFPAVHFARQGWCGSFLTTLRPIAWTPRFL